jgi:hypothetical protein
MEGKVTSGLGLYCRGSMRFSCDPSSRRKTRGEEDVVLEEEEEVDDDDVVSLLLLLLLEVDFCVGSAAAGEAKYRLSLGLSPLLISAYLTVLDFVAVVLFLSGICCRTPLLFVDVDW